MTNRIKIEMKIAFVTTLSARHMVNSDRHEASSCYAILYFPKNALQYMLTVEVWQRRQKWARLFTSNRVRERKVFHFHSTHTTTNIIVRTFLPTLRSLNLSSRSEAALDEGGMVDGRKKSINGMMRKGHKTFVAPFFAFPLFKDFCTQVKFFVTLEARTHTFGCRWRFFFSQRWIHFHRVDENENKSWNLVNV